MSNNDSSGNESAGCGCPVDGCTYTGSNPRGTKMHLAKAHSEPTKRTVRINDLQRVADLVNGTPTANDYREHGRYSVLTYTNSFGSWNEALEDAELVTNRERNVSQERLLKHLRDLSHEIDRTPRRRDMDSCGDYASNTYANRFGTWNSALEEAGLAMNKKHAIPKEDLLAELHRLADVIGRTPTRDEMATQGKYHFKPYMNTFGSWTEAIREVGLPVKWRQNIPKEDLIEEMLRLADELGRAPYASDMIRDGVYDWKSYRRTFGSWNAAVESAGLDVFEPLTGEDSPHYTPFGNSLYLTLRKFYSDENWRSISKRMLQRADYECHFKHCDQEAHDVHHIEPIMSVGTNSDDLLMPLCTTHHRKIELYTKENISEMTIKSLVSEFSQGHGQAEPDVVPVQLSLDAF